MQTGSDYDFFAAHLDAGFGLAPGLELVLYEIEKFPSSSPDKVSFSLLFRGPLAPQLEQGSYALSPPGLPARDIFLVPIARDQQGMQYQAIFN